MAITTEAAARAGMQTPVQHVKTAFAVTAGGWYSLWNAGGLPNQGSTPSSGLSGNTLSSGVAGSLLPFVDNPSGNQYLGEMTVNTAQNDCRSAVFLLDRLWHNSGITITSTASQTVNSVTLPARDVNDSTNGEGVYAALEVYVQTGAVAVTPTITYTNSDGVAGRTATPIVTIPAAALGAGTFIPYRLQAGDKGVRSIQSYQQSASWSSGTVGLVLFRPYLMQEVGGVSSQDHVVDAVTAGMPRLPASACLWLAVAQASANGTFNVRFTQTNG